MNRLTRCENEAIWVKEGPTDPTMETLICPWDEGFTAMMKLAEYENAEENGLLVQCHCSECAHVEHEGKLTILCGKTGRRMEKDDFCKYAERRKGNNDKL